MTRRFFGSTALLVSIVATAIAALTPPTLAQRPSTPAQGVPSTVEGREQTTPAATESASAKYPLTEQVFSGLRAREIGPAVMSGRVMSLAVHPGNTAIIYVGVASGGVWKTVNGGASWQPIFDREGSFSIGWVTLDPTNPNVVWVGTGENNSQRSVAYGDGVYKSVDAGRTWKNVGLKASEHIGRIVVNPKDPNTVYVAAQGPLWAPGGDRGLYKTTDGGATWNKVLNISEHTGVTDLVLDPRNPDIIVAAAYQRRRHQWTMIDGGPESAIHRSTDGGKTWTRITSGLPSEELGRIGLAMSPVNADVMYAIVEAANRRGGVYRSADGGVTWTRGADYNQGAMYYGAIFADPHDVDRLYIMDVNLQVSDDGGRTVRPLGTRNVHVDHHVIWIDPKNRDHYLIGNDGGVYQSWDRAQTWVYFPNLPITQFYDVDVDNAVPFYNVYGGTQDNNSLGGPSRTKSVHGILNQDWFVTQGGDGFVSHPDPEDPNTVYAELQHGVIVRFDRRTGERIGIQPKEEKGDPPLKWNWDAPFIISPHSHTRLYMASQFLYRTDDRGNTWRKISGDLTRQIDRNALPIMGKVWGPDAIAKNTSTALYSNVSAVAESPRKEGLLYTGSDDGLIQVSEDGGSAWRKAGAAPGVPETAYVSRIRASLHNANTVYATFEHHQSGDFTPYVMKSTDAGRTWSSIAGDLPKRGSVYAVAEDHVNANLLFVGTEFGASFTTDGGQHWITIAGLPTIAVRELAIQKRENDLVMATFGRGFWVLDDYTPLRTTTAATLKTTSLFPSRGAYLYVPEQRFGGNGRASQGEMLYLAENPPYGAVFTFYRPEALQTLRQKRVAAEQAAEKAGQPIRYPTPDEFRAEAEEEAPVTLLTITASSGKEVRTITAPIGRGFQRVAWDLRAPAPVVPAAGGGGGAEGGQGGGPTGPYVVPGKYKVTLSQRVGGSRTELAGPVEFDVKLEPNAVATLADHEARWTFFEKWLALNRQVNGAVQLANATDQKLDLIRRALDVTPNAPKALFEQVRTLKSRLTRILIALRGDTALSQRQEPTPASITERVNGINGDMARSFSRPTATHEAQYALGKQLFDAELVRLRAIVATEIPAMERELERAGAPWTPGRIPGAQP